MQRTCMENQNPKNSSGQPVPNPYLTRTNPYLTRTNPYLTRTFRLGKNTSGFVGKARRVFFKPLDFCGFWF